MRTFICVTVIAIAATYFQEMGLFVILMGMAGGLAYAQDYKELKK